MAEWQIFLVKSAAVEIFFNFSGEKKFNVFQGWNLGILLFLPGIWQKPSHMRFPERTLCTFSQKI